MVRIKINVKYYIYIYTIYNYLYLQYICNIYEYIFLCINISVSIYRIKKKSKFLKKILFGLKRERKKENIRGNLLRVCISSHK